MKFNMACFVCQSIDTDGLIRYKPYMRKSIIWLFILTLLVTSCKGSASTRNLTAATPAGSNALGAPGSITALPTASPTPNLPPTPTPQPAVRVELAEQALFVGDYETARREFQDALTASSDPEVQAAASLGVGRSFYLAKNYTNAVDALNRTLTTYPDSPVNASVYYFLARTYDAQSQFDRAAQAYGKYLELRPGVLDAYMQERRGDALMSAGSPAEAVEAYEAAYNAPRQGETMWIALKLGQAYASLGDYSNAIKTYLQVYETSDNDYARAQANLLMGQTYMAMGEPEQAYTRYLDSVEKFPRSYDTYSGLVQLVNDGIPVSNLNRGIVDYYAGQYGLAIEAFSRYIDSGEAQDATAYHYRALSYLAKNDPEPAVADWDYVINNFQADELWPTAWDEKAYTQWAYLDKYDDAANTLLEYINLAPESAQAPEYMFFAARIMERNNRLAEAANTWEQIMARYPSATNSYRGLFLAGVTYFRIADYTAALTIFQRAMVLANTPEEQASAYLWIGKTQLAKGDPNAARLAWEQGAQRDPTGYYSERANELLQGRDPFVVTRPVDLGYDLAQERPRAEQWLRSTFNLEPGIDLSGLGDLASDLRMQRAAEYWELGLYWQARVELESLRLASTTDPIRTYRLMNYMVEIGLYRSAILASRQILDLANLDDAGTLTAPPYFNHIRFGVYFKDQILKASEDEDFHPLFLLSLMRQESLFEGFAESGAGARGLMQIMPATGQEVASSMSWPADFTTEDLYRPEISIRLGARYLSRQRTYFENDMYATLAAYNGGPGNTIYWKQLAGDDPDLLLEVIRAEETRLYITQIYEFFNIYRLIYERGL